MKCPNCNQEAEPSAVFCGNCGGQLQQPAAPQPVEPVAQPFAPPVAGGESTPQPTSARPVDGAVPTAPAPTPIMAPVAQPIPAYATAHAKPAEGGGLLTAAVVLAALSIPGAIIPLVGLVFSITAIVLAVKHHHLHTGKMVTATVMASIGLILSLTAFGYNVSHRATRTGFAPTGSMVASAAVVQPDPATYRALFASNW